LRNVGILAGGDHKDDGVGRIANQESLGDVFRTPIVITVVQRLHSRRLVDIELLLHRIRSAGGLRRG
jgi:hypothetical protein